MRSFGVFLSAVPRRLCPLRCLVSVTRAILSAAFLLTGLHSAPFISPCCQLCTVLVISQAARLARASARSISASWRLCAPCLRARRLVSERTRPWEPLPSDRWILHTSPALRVSTHRNQDTTAQAHTLCIQQCLYCRHVHATSSNVQ